MGEFDSLPQYLLEPLNERHGIPDFDARSGLLNGYLRIQALKEQTQDLAHTYVLIDAADSANPLVIGYFTLRAEPYFIQGGTTVPMVELAYLARHIRLHGQGIGTVLLFEAFRIAIRVAELIGASGMQLAPTDEGRKLYSRFGFVDHAYGNSILFLPMAEIRALVEAADRP